MRSICFCVCVVEVGLVETMPITSNVPARASMGSLTAMTGLLVKLRISGTYEQKTEQQTRMQSASLSMASNISRVNVRSSSSPTRPRLRMAASMCSLTNCSVATSGASSCKALTTGAMAR